MSLTITDPSDSFVRCKLYSQLCVINFPTNFKFSVFSVTREDCSSLETWYCFSPSPVPGPHQSEPSRRLGHTTLNFKYLRQSCHINPLDFRRGDASVFVIRPQDAESLDGVIHPKLLYQISNSSGKNTVALDPTTQRLSRGHRSSSHLHDSDQSGLWKR